jgi:hypothetical protein
MVVIITLNNQRFESDTAGVNPGNTNASNLMLFPSALLIEEYIRAIPEGESRDIPTMQRDLAARYNALTTNREATRKHLRAIAEDTFDGLDNGAPLGEVIPVWRVLGARAGTLLDELSFDPAILFELRAGERSHAAELDRHAA